MSATRAGSVSFFDVVFVVAIAQLAHELAVDHSLRGFAVFAALFLPVFIAHRRPLRHGRHRLPVAIFAAMLAIAALAVQVPDVAHGESTGFVVAYAVLRSLMVALYLRSYRHVPPARPLIARYAAGYSFGISLWLLPRLRAPERYALWGIALAWEYSLPVASAASTAPSRSVLPRPRALRPRSRSVFGETIVAVALGTDRSDWALAAAVAGGLGFAVSALLWWIYFGTGAGMETRPRYGILVFTHAHIPVLAALTAVSAGVAIAIEQASRDQLDDGGRWALGGGAAATGLPDRGAAGARARRVPPEGDRTGGDHRGAGTARGHGDRSWPGVFVAATVALLLALVVFEMWAYSRMQARST